MYSSVISGTVRGIESYLVQVEVSISEGLPCFEMVGFLSNEVREARERVKVALMHSGILIPPKRIIVNLSPASIRKVGNAFDLPIAIAILTALGIIPEVEVEKTLFMGELGLSGETKFVSGVLPIVLYAKEEGIKKVLLPTVNYREAKAVDDVSVIGIQNLQEAIACLQSGIHKNIQKVEEIYREEPKKQFLDFNEINGQVIVKRAVEVAAAGFHHIMLVGPPGSGKTMVAQRIPGILPKLSKEESLEVSKLYSVAGLLTQNCSLIVERPFLNPHHTISEQAFAGGGRIPKPGAISLAHRGVLFLDELPEFKRSTLEIMRQPIEDKQINIARNSGSFSYPAEFMMVGAMNPCPCGHYPNVQKCNCKEYEIMRYQKRLSGPLLDRIDIWVDTPMVAIKDLTSNQENESSKVIAKRVQNAREIQEERYAGTGILFNSQLSAVQVKQYCLLGKKELAFLERIFNSMQLSARAYHRIIKVARTIADLAQVETINIGHLSEAVHYRITNEAYQGRKSDL